MLRNTIKILSASLILGSLLSTTARADWMTWTVAAGGNGHSYLAVPGYRGLTWNIANQQAQAQGGYLASITSQAENDFVFSLINSSPFFNGFNGAGPAIGGYQYDELSEPAGHWAWTSGEAWSYSNWHSVSPNNLPAGQNNLIFYSGAANTPAATWDDVAGNDSGPGNYGLGGYVIEVVPEPGVGSILACGALLFLRGLKRKGDVKTV